MAHNNRLTFAAIFRLIVGVLLFLSGIACVAATNPVPLINQPLVPDAAKPGGAAFTLTVNGTGFVSGSVVHWNGSPRTTTFVNGAQLKANILAPDIAADETGRVTVVNPAPGGGTSNVAFFGVNTPASHFGLSEIGYATADRSYSVAVGDFNGDGKLDLAVADYATSTVSVLLGNGDGTFKPHVEYATGQFPQYVVLGDFNNDGKLDLVVSNNGSNTISILLGNGDGTFRPQVEYATGDFPLGMAVADFNRDGKLDLVVTNSILLGNGDGTFQPAVNIAGTQSGSPAVGDFNRDGKLDLVLVNSTGSVSVLLGNGDGTFQPAVNYSTGPTPTSVAVADFNADDKLDLAVTNQTDGTVSILLGNGDGTFRTHVDYATGSSNPCSIAVGDFNGDGRPDLVIADLESTDVRLLLGNGDGTFAAVASYSAGSGSYPSSVAVGDFNGDGSLDVAAADSSIAMVSVLLNSTVLLSNSNLTFGDQQIHSSSPPQSVTLTNVGPLALSIGSIAITGTDASDFSRTDTCGSSVPALGGSCTISITFTPTVAGLRTASITITDNAHGSPQLILLTGTGVVPEPVATLSASSLTFSAQVVGTSSTAQSVTLTNSGSVALNIIGVSFSGADPGDFSQTNTCGASLASGANCSISITFTPKIKGTRSAALALADNAPGSPQLIALSGAGTVVQLNPAGLRFSCRISQHNCPPPPQSSTLTNIGTTPLAISSITISGAFSETNNCPSVLSPSGSCTITVHFTRTATGQFAGSVSITDDGGGSPQQLSLSGVVKSAVTNAALSALGTTATATVPKPTGSSPIGTRIVQVVDRVRDDPFIGSPTKRKLLLRFWYPASMSDGCEPAAYTTPALWNYFSQLVGFPLPDVNTNSCLDAPFSEGSHPVVVFTHGYTGTFTDYTFLFEDLASRGYVVASIDHTYEATAVEFSDGRFVKSVLGSHLDDSWQTDDDTLSRALSARLDDLTFVMRELETLNASGGSPFAGKLDLTRVALAGHSLGGLTTWLDLQREPRFKAAVLLDPYLVNIGSDPTKTPVLLMAMGSEKPSQDECRLWSDLHGPGFLVNLRGAEHVTPSDAVWLARGAIRTGATGPEKTIDAMRRYIAAFLDSTLRGEPPDVLLEGSSSEFPDISVTSQEQPLCRQP